MIELTGEHKCPFLNKNKLCKLVTAYGDNVLSLIHIFPDGDFPTVSYPNPEAAEAFELGLALGKKVDADLILATDPDADLSLIHILCAVPKEQDGMLQECRKRDPL